MTPIKRLLLAWVFCCLCAMTVQAIRPPRARSLRRSLQEHSGKGNGKGNGKGKGSGDLVYYAKDGKKGKKGKKGKRESGRGVDCSAFDWLDWYAVRGGDSEYGGKGKGKGKGGVKGKGKGKGGKRARQRQLQFEGADCERDIVYVAEESGLSTFTMLLEAAGLSDIFSCAGPFTGFIPSNAAFDALDPNMVQFLADNPEMLQEVLLYHLLPGFALTQDMEPAQVATLQGSNALITTGPVTMNGVPVRTPDIMACNGVINIIDRVLLPPGFPVIGMCTCTFIEWLLVLCGYDAN